MTSFSRSFAIFFDGFGSFAPHGSCSCSPLQTAQPRSRPTFRPFLLASDVYPFSMPWCRSHKASQRPHCRVPKAQSLVPSREWQSAVFSKLVAIPGEWRNPAVPEHWNGRTTRRSGCSATSQTSVWTESAETNLHTNPLHPYLPTNMAPCFFFPRHALLLLSCNSGVAGRGGLRSATAARQRTRGSSVPPIFGVRVPGAR